MFGFFSGVPSRMRHLLSRFRRYSTRPQYENFYRVTLGLMVAGEKELFTEKKDRSSMNRFFTEPKWDVEQVVGERKSLLLSENHASRVTEYKIIDDTVCRKYALARRWSATTTRPRWGPSSAMITSSPSTLTGTSPSRTA